MALPSLHRPGRPGRPVLLPPLLQRFALLHRRQMLGAQLLHGCGHPCSICGGLGEVRLATSLRARWAEGLPGKNGETCWKHLEHLGKKWIKPGNSGYMSPFQDGYGHVKAPFSMDKPPSILLSNNYINQTLNKKNKQLLKNHYINNP